MPSNLRLQLQQDNLNVIARTGERNAVRIEKSGLPVDHSGPELRVGPTLPATAGRKPEARPPIYSAISPLSAGSSGLKETRAAGLSQRKSGPKRGHEVPASITDVQGTPVALDDHSISDLLSFFRTLDRWDQEAHGTKTM